MINTVGEEKIIFIDDKLFFCGHTEDKNDDHPSNVSALKENLI
jgi:hypothetical protein